ncbi:type I polyketide synthase [Silvanigrella aquatica]|uniref:Carrier domain-containing protein n=1 Tax=Silvanigrella aquatica TaxID=1915309 RepID=A0A1L4CYU1_9BACT|nr:type I polyketide synthase [Silvanigrella aquatica]APJ03118.1 hypothetical protein AXG55_04020 [Silvanigrella aquatica]
MTNSIAIIGMAGRFPGAKNINEFWENLCLGKESISTFSLEELLNNGVSTELLENENYVRAKGYLEGAELFDANFFNISPREAETMDPQHRVFLECAWEALENAGYYSENEAGRISVIAGVSGLGSNSYYQQNLAQNEEVKKHVSNYQLNINNGSDFFSTRVSYKLNFTGPSYTIQSGCSTSLLAIAQACQNLITYQCDVALAGAATIEMPIKTGYLYQNGMILSPDGHCKAFDAEANGTVPGNGVGIVVLKRLEEAITDKDTIYTVIKGFAINNDGNRKIGYTAPSTRGQSSVIAEAQAIAGISPETISYVEAHGTGTKKGDPIELAGLIEAFKEKTKKKQYCALGSVKTNIGHLDATAGVAGLIKTALCFTHKQLPPSLHFSSPHPEIDFLNSPFYVNTKLKKWEKEGNLPRRAGLSSFGIGGTNVHLVLEEAPSKIISHTELKEHEWKIIPLSAKNPKSLEKMRLNLFHFLENNPEVSLEDTAYTYQTGRCPFSFRSVIIAKDRNELIFNPKKTSSQDMFLSESRVNNVPQVAFVFLGNHDYYINMSWNLYQNYSVFRETIDTCSCLVKEMIKIDIRTILYPNLFSHIEIPFDFKNKHSLTNYSEIKTLILFIFEYAMGKLWIELGAKPDVLISHSTGIYAAACLAEVFSLTDGLKLVAYNSKLLPNHIDDILEISFFEPKTALISPYASELITSEDAKNYKYWTKYILESSKPHSGLDFINRNFEKYLFLNIDSQSIFLDKLEKNSENYFDLSILNLHPHPKGKNTDYSLNISILLAKMWLSGILINWKIYNTNFSGKKVSLPTYPFQHEKYWIEKLNFIEVKSLNSKDEKKIFVANNSNVMSKNDFAIEIAKIWSQYLGISSIDINDNFFELGGDSLTANQAIHNIQQVLSVSCPVSIIFNYPTPIALASHLFPQKNSIDMYNCKDKFDDNHIGILSFTQQRIWFLEQYEAGIYNVPLAIKLTGLINIKNLEKSFNILIERHQSLRSVFRLDEQSNPQQFSLPPYLIDLNVHIIQESEIDSILKQESHSLFDLAVGPLFTVKLYKLTEREHILFINQHHIITDGWSINILFDELSIIYNRLNNNIVKNLNPLNYQYSEFSLYQKKLIQESSFKEQIKFWEKTLSNYSQLELKTDYQRPLVAKHVGKSFYFELEGELSESLKNIGKNNSATLFMVLLSGLNILLHRYSNQDDIIVGTPIANRSNERMKSIIGFFANTIVIRNKITVNQTYIDFLEQVKQNCSDAYNNQDIPFEKLLEILDIQRDTSRNPIFQVMMLLQQKSTDEYLKLSDLQSEVIHNCYDTSQFDLTFHLCEKKSGLTCRIEYNTSLFREETIAKIKTHFKNILCCIAENPDTKISSIQLQSKLEIQELLYNRNKTEELCFKNKTIHQLFAEQVAKTPDLIAVYFEDNQITYRELDLISNKYSFFINEKYYEHYQKNILNDSLIGICLDRSLEMVIVLLAILKTGAAYVPLDSTYPEKRLKGIIEDSKITLIISEEKILNNKFFLNQYNNIIVLLNDFNKNEYNESFPTSQNISSANDLAYVLYTSGSTGLPKGVMIEHASVTNLLQDFRKKLHISSENCLISGTSINFDISVLEIFLPLISGAKLRFLSHIEARDPEKFAFYIKENSNCIVQATPSVWSMLVDLLSNSTPKDMITLVGGEQLNESLAKKLLNLSRKVWNVYGPTETTIWSTYNELLVSTDYKIIGNCFANTQIYILNDNLNLVPDGVIGELHISGNGLARGYLNQPKLTSEKFIDNPFMSSIENSRIYKTGDLVRWLEDKGLEYIGRSDSQVKILGHRIEISEIEHALSKHEFIEKCICNVHSYNEQKQIIAYYIPVISENKIPDSEREFSAILKTYLAQELVEYMIPYFFIKLSEFPLTSNKKIDRNKLPPPNYNKLINITPNSIPQNKVEDLIASIWCEVLSLQKVDIDTSFFTLGGNSLLITKVHYRLNKIGYKVSIIDLFKYPTIRLISLEIEKLNSISSSEINISQTKKMPKRSFLSYKDRINSKNNNGLN